jgi:hypothetical protein
LLIAGKKFVKFFPALVRALRARKVNPRKVNDIGQLQGRG